MGKLTGLAGQDQPVKRFLDRRGTPLCGRGGEARQQTFGQLSGFFEIGEDAFVEEAAFKAQGEGDFCGFDLKLHQEFLKCAGGQFERLFKVADLVFFSEVDFGVFGVLPEAVKGLCAAGFVFPAGGEQGFDEFQSIGVMGGLAREGVFDQGSALVCA